MLLETRSRLKGLLFVGEAFEGVTWFVCESKQVVCELLDR